MKLDGFMDLRDYVTVSVRADCPERFINLCRNRGVALSDVRLNGESLECAVKRGQFVQLRQIRRITGGRIRIKHKQGFRYLMFKYRKHYSFVIGMFIACCLIRWINMYVWDIDFEGNGLYSDAYLESYLESHGISVGTSIADVDCEWLSLKIREDMSEVIWADVSISGTRLNIAVKENEVAASESENVGVSNIYASEDGTVASILVRSGTPLVKQGESVSQGQLLVSGEITIEDAYGEYMSTVTTYADADIMIDTSLKYIDSIVSEYQEKEYTGKIKRTYVITAFGKEITFLKRHVDEGYDISNESVAVKLFGLIRLPVQLNIIKYIQYENVTKSYDDDEMRDVLVKRFDSYIKNLQNSVQIIDNDVKINEDDAGFTMEGIIRVVAPCVQYEAGW